MCSLSFKIQLLKQKKDTRGYLRAWGNCQEKMEKRKRKDRREKEGRDGGKEQGIIKKQFSP